MFFTQYTLKLGTMRFAKRMLSFKKIPEKIAVNQISVNGNIVEINKIREINWQLPESYEKEIENERFQIIKYRGYELLVNSNYNSY